MRLGWCSDDLVRRLHVAMWTDRTDADPPGTATGRFPLRVVSTEEEPARAIGADIGRTVRRRCISQMGQRSIDAVDCETRDRIRLGTQRDEQKAAVRTDRHRHCLASHRGILDLAQLSAR